MLLYEFEAKQILKNHGLAVPDSQLLTSSNQSINIPTPLVLKAQTLSGKRKAAGGVIFVTQDSDLSKAQKDLFSKKINNEEINTILVESLIEHASEYYVSISYDTEYRGPVFVYSESGGTDIENRHVTKLPLNPLSPSLPDSFPQEIFSVLQTLVKVFFIEDLLLLEINPLVVAKSGLVIALDAKINTDNDASTRHSDRSFPSRGVPGHIPTINELAAKKIDSESYRGTAGSTYFDLPGDIAVLASGGGASLTGMDALIKAGGNPANYTEYSADPSREKVKQLTHIVLSKPDLHGLWIVGAVANFTDIFETLSGILEALKEIAPKPKFPIVIRRGGPRDQEAFDMLKQVTDFDLHVYGSETSITQSADIMVNLAHIYATTSR